MSDRKWKEIIENAMASVANDHKLYAYHSAGEHVGLRFNSIYEVVAATFDGQNYCPVQTLSLDEKVLNDFMELISAVFSASLTAVLPFLFFLLSIKLVLLGSERTFSTVSLLLHIRIPNIPLC